jgi:Zn-dependent peptidase ImmA (M78 family)
MDKNCDPIAQAINLKKTKGRIDVIELANNLGIKVFSTNDINYPSIIAFDPELKEYEIYVNSNEPRERQRFSIAHEIAHFWKHQEKIIQFGAVGRQNVCSLSAAEEKDADNYAAEILMPRVLIEEYLENNNITQEDKIGDNTVRQLAKEYEVSIPVSAIKLRDMGYYVRYV